MGGCDIMSTLRRLVTLLVLIAVPFSLAAKPKEKAFDASPDRVYAAVQKVMRDHYIVTFADDKQMMVSFQTPQTAWFVGMSGSASVEAENGRGTLHITLQRNDGKIQDSIIKWVGEELYKKN
jgi:hypothetical protein